MSNNIRLEARPKDGSADWTEIFPSQLNWVVKQGHDVRAVETTAPEPVREALRQLVYRIRQRSTNKLHNREYQMTLDDCVRELAALSAAPGEPCAWLVERERDPTFPRLYKSREDAVRMVESINVNPAATITSLRREAPAPAEGVLTLGPENEAFHRALKQYPEGFAALHFFWNEVFAGQPQSRPDTAESRLREAVEDAIDTLESMDLHVDNPLYERLVKAISPPSGGDEAKES